MKKITKILISLSIFLMLFSPALSYAVVLVPCSNTPVNGVIPPADQCNFTALMNMVNIVIHFILFDMAVPIAAIMFVYAGFLLVTAGGETSSARTKAKSIFLNALIGLVIAFACWLIVKTILTTLGYTDGAWIGF